MKTFLSSIRTSELILNKASEAIFVLLKTPLRESGLTLSTSSLDALLGCLGVSRAGAGGI